MTKRRAKWMSLGELLDHVMKTKGLSEEDAKKEILEALRSGKLTATGIPVKQPRQ